MQELKSILLYAGKTCFWVIKVKNSATIHPKDLRSLKTCGEDYPGAETFLVYRSRERLKRDDISIVSAAEFPPGMM